MNAGAQAEVDGATIDEDAVKAAIEGAAAGAADAKP